MSKLPTEQRINELWKELVKECEESNWIPTKDLWMDKLGILSRTTYNKWKKKVNAIKRIDKMIENAWVQRLTSNNVAGTIFYLKNAFQYRDNQGVDITSGGKPVPLFDYVKQNRNNPRNSKDKKTKEKT